MTHALIAGTFDPPTKGHAYLMEKGAALFDTVTVAIGKNQKKQEALSLEKRLSLLAHIAEGIPHGERCRFDSYQSAFLPDYARSIGAGVLIRGMRSITDFEEEKDLLLFTGKRNPGITPIYLLAPDSLSFIRSSTIKGMIGYADWETAIQPYLPTPAYRAMLEQFHGLQDRFHAAWEKTGAHISADTVYDKILSNYSESRRHYHTLVHIAECLTEYDTIIDQLKNPLAVEIAIYLHDIIYAPLDNYNEAQSALLSREYLSRSTLDKDVDTLISSTTHKDFIFLDEDVEYLLDIDLAILGQSQERFDEYERDIRKEYNHVPEDTFRFKRAGILQAFLDRESIYHTEPFKEKYEVQARKNLSRSIQQLREMYLFSTFESHDVKIEGPATPELASARTEAKKGMFPEGKSPLH